MKATIYEYKDGQSIPIGEFYLAGNKIAAKALTDDDKDKQNLLEIAGWGAGRTPEVSKIVRETDQWPTAESHPELWLRSLPMQFKGSTFLSAKMEE